MKTFGWIILAIILLIGVVYVINYCEETKYPTEIPVNDTIYVAGDTVWIPSDTVYVLRWKNIPAITEEDTNGMVTKSFSKDTTVINNQDTIMVEIEVDYYPTDDYFDLGLGVTHKDYDFSVVDTIKVTEYVPVEVKVTNPMWIITTIVATLALLAALIFGG